MRSYAWAPARSLATGDPRLDNNPFFHKRVQDDVERALTARGFEKTEGGSPDLILHYHASVAQRLDLGGSDLPACTGCVPFVFDSGTIVLDFVDTQTNTLVWRAWTEESLGPVIDSQELMERRIDQAVARLMERLPHPL
jgi:hypothetical protein